jgi:hypothetical protein
MASWVLRWYISPKRRFTYRIHGAISQKIATFITAAVRTPYRTWSKLIFICQMHFQWLCICLLRFEVNWTLYILRTIWQVFAVRVSHTFALFKTVHTLYVACCVLPKRNEIEIHSIDLKLKHAAKKVMCLKALGSRNRATCVTGHTLEIQGVTQSPISFVLAAIWSPQLLADNTVLLQMVTNDLLLKKFAYF